MLAAARVGLTIQALRRDPLLAVAWSAWLAITFGISTALDHALRAYTQLRQ